MRVGRTVTGVKWGPATGLSRPAPQFGGARRGGLNGRRCAASYAMTSPEDAHDVALRGGDCRFPVSCTFALAAVAAGSPADGRLGIAGRGPDRLATPADRGGGARPLRAARCCWRRSEGAGSSRGEALRAPRTARSDPVRVQLRDRLTAHRLGHGGPRCEVLVPPILNSQSIRCFIFLLTRPRHRRHEAGDPTHGRGRAPCGIASACSLIAASDARVRLQRTSHAGGAACVARATTRMAIAGRADRRARAPSSTCRYCVRATARWRSWRTQTYLSTSGRGQGGLHRRRCCAASSSATRCATGSPWTSTSALAPGSARQRIDQPPTAPGARRWSATRGSCASRNATTSSLKREQMLALKRQ